METKKIIVDNKEIEITTDINENEIEDNLDLFDQTKFIDDTINLDNVVKEIEGSDKNG